MGHKRIHYIDWLRVLAVLLLFPFHTWRVYNFDDPFYVKSAQTSMALNYVIDFIDRWHMPLLFVLAGIGGTLAGLSGYFFPQIRNAETILPDYDALPAESPVAGQPA